MTIEAAPDEWSARLRMILPSPQAHEEPASTGTRSREAVVRVLRELDDEGVVTLGRESVRLIQVPGHRRSA